MKKLLILSVLAMMLGGMTGCRFMECLWRGPACRQQNAAPATVTCPAPCATTCGDPCSGATIVTPGPETYAPAAS